MQVVYPIREGPFRLARSTFGHCQNSNWTPPPALNRALYIYIPPGSSSQRYADEESSSPRAHCKCNDPGICFVLVYLCLCSFLQWSRTRPWWRLSQVSITWFRRRAGLKLFIYIFNNLFCSPWLKKQIADKILLSFLCSNIISLWPN